MNEPVSRFEKIAHVSLLSALILVAFSVPYHFSPIGFFYEEFLAGAISVVGGCLSWALMPSFRSVSVLSLVWLLWGAVVAVSYSLGEYTVPASGLWYLVYWFVAALAIVWFSRMKSLFGVERLILVCATLLTVALIVQVIGGMAKFYGFLRFIGSPEMPVTRLPGLLNQYNITAALVSMGLASSFYLFICRKIGHTMLACLTVGSVILLSLTDTRSVYLYALAFLVLISFILSGIRNGSSRREKKRIMGGGLVIIFGCLIAIFLAPTVDSGLIKVAPSDLDRSPVENTSSTRSIGDVGIRFAEAQKALEVFYQHPFFGVGPDNYSYMSFQMDEQVPTLNSSFGLPNHTHNIFTMVLAEEGAVGIIVLIGGMVYLLICWVRLPCNREWLWVGSLLAIFFIYSNVEFPLWYMHYLVMFVGICVLIVPSASFRIDSKMLNSGTAIAIVVVMAFLGDSLLRGFTTLVRATAQNQWSEETVARVSGWQADSFLGPYAHMVEFGNIVPGRVDMFASLRSLTIF
ncbi:PglL family O-oligosaccharyltransferase [Tamilnaduibacter salinus]|nr:O-antigen ligase family protein [Tamilnaduibacter salinus]